MSFLTCMVSVVLAILAFRVRGRFERFLIQLASLLMVIYALHQLHVF